jgi:glycosyltransferase involved in cell wall biosynthesis
MTHSLDTPLLILSNSGGYGGAPRSMEGIVMELSRHYLVHICAENIHHVTNLNKLANPRVHVHALQRGKGLRKMFANVLFLRKLVLQVKPGIILTNTNKAAMFLGILSRLGLAHVPKFVFVRDFQWKNQRLIWALIGKATLLVPSKAVTEREHFLPHWPVVEIPNFANHPASIPVHPMDSKMVLCLAMVSRWKGINYLVDAFALAVQESPDLTLVVVGKIIDKTHLLQIRNTIKKAGLEHKIRFEAYTNSVESYYQQAMVVVNSSISEFGGPETFGRTLIESWAHACPVVSFDSGGPHYIIDHGINGFLVPEKDVRSMANHLIELEKNPSMRVQMGIAGYRKVQEEYSADRTRQAMLEALSHPSVG